MTDHSHDHDHDHHLVLASQDQGEVHRIILYAMRISLGVSVLMLLGKVGAYLLTGSAAILSDAMESIIHIVATGLAAWSALIASRPPSRAFPYGKAKIAYFSAGVEGALIFSAACAIHYKAIEALIYGGALRRLDWGLVTIVSLSLINMFLGLYLVRTGKQHNSLILEANGEHVLTDMWTSFAVVVGVALVWLTGQVWLDPLVAMLAAFHIMYSAIKLLKKAFDGLMEQVSETLSEPVLQVLQASVDAGEISAFHQLRMRSVQRDIWIEVHLLMPGGLSLRDAHVKACLIEEQIEERFGAYDVYITSHLEPEAHQHEHPDGHGPLPDPLDAPKDPQASR